MFNMTRIPQPECDMLYKGHPSDSASRQIVVLIRNHMFLVDVYREGDTFVGLDTMVRQLSACARSVSSVKSAVAIPVLTADDRETWAKVTLTHLQQAISDCTQNRTYLGNLSVENQAALSSIDSSLFCISLDTATNNVQNSHIRIDGDNLTNPRWDDHLHNTAYGQNGYNRWFDKTISMSVESNTRLGMMGEHSPCDALIPSILGDYCVEAPMNLEEFDQASTENDLLANRESGWRRIAWTTDGYLQSECQRVAEQAQTLVEDSDDSQLWFEDYGVDWIRGTGRSLIPLKTQLFTNRRAVLSAKLSPDAYIQMALQLAWYKNQGKFSAVYETASTRLFLHGRTEVIRSLSRESLLFVQAMNHPNVKVVSTFCRVSLT